MSEDAYGIEPPNPARPEPPRREPDEEDYGYDPDPPYPQSVTTAGVLWIIYGCLAILSSAATLLMNMGAAANAGGPAGGVANISGGIGGLACGALFGAAFLFVGVQSIQGTARDTLGNGVGSIIFALLYFGVATVLLLFGGSLGVTAVVMAAVVILTGVLLLTAGILALVGRGSYREWKRAQMTRWEREAAERRGRRRFRG